MATTKATTLAHTLGGISSDISTAEINRLDGVTGDLQTQLDAKLATATASSTYAPKASPQFTGNVGIGTDPDNADTNAKNLVVGSGSGSEGMTIYTGTGNSGHIYFSDGTTGGDRYKGQINYDHSSNGMTLYVNGSERFFLDSVGQVRTKSNSGGVYDLSARFGGGSDPSTALSIANNNSCKLDGGTNGSFLILVYSGSAGQGAAYHSSYLGGVVKLGGHSDFTASSSSGSYRLYSSGHTVNMYNYGGSTQVFYFTVIGAFLS